MENARKKVPSYFAESLMRTHIDMVNRCIETLTVALQAKDELAVDDILTDMSSEATNFASHAFAIAAGVKGGAEDADFDLTSFLDVVVGIHSRGIRDVVPRIVKAANKAAEAAR